MRRPPTLLLVPLVLVVFVSGCLEDAPLDPSALDVEAPAAPAFSVGMGGCVEAGSVSMYNIADNRMVPEPWEAEDIRDDLGNPALGSYGVPITGPATGIWHMSVICDSYDFDGAKTHLIWGWVGVKVKPPPWDDGAVARQFILADLSFGDEAIQERLVADPGFHVSHTLDGKVEWLPGDVMHSIMRDTSHGSFETFAGLKEYRALDLPTTRFWFPIAADGHGHDAEGQAEEGFRPVSLDFEHTVSAPAEHWVINNNVRAFAHTKEQMVGPVAVPQVEHYGYTGGAILFQTFERTMTLGPAPEEILLETTWTH